MAPTDLEPYREALRDQICGSCLDRTHDGECGRAADRPCALESHLETLVGIVLRMDGDPDVGAYVDALRSELCPTCNQDEEGNCARREQVHCVLNSDIIPVIDVIETVAEREGHRPG